MAFLLLALVGGVNSVWAADAVSQTASAYKSDFTDGQVVWLTRTGMNGQDWITIATETTSNVTPYTDPSTGEAYSGDALAIYRVKQWNGRYLEFWVTGVSSITFYANHPSLEKGVTKDARTMKATVNQTSETSPVEIVAIAKGVSENQGYGTVELTPNANNKIRVYATGDMDLYAMKVTVPAATEAPTITSNLASSADVYVGVAQDFSITASGATSYQWYKASSTTADIENDDAIDGATSSSYSYTAANAGTEYLYCAATNAIGSTLSTVCAVTATSVAFHIVTYNLGDATGGTVPTQADVAEGNTFTVAAAPGDLVPPSGKEFKCWNDGTSDYEPGATYTMSTSDVTLTAVYQDRTYKGLTPATIMDFSNPGNMFVSVWTTANNLKENFYFDPVNGITAISAYAIYQIKKGTWMDTDSGNSTDDSWSATGNFKGNSYYFNSSPKAATVRATARMHYYRVKGITGASALMGGKAKMEAYLVTAGAVSADPVSENSIDAEGTLSITGLNTSNEYIIKVYGDNGNSNVKFREIAFAFTPVTSVSGTITPAGWSTFACSYPLDLSTISGGAAYYASAASGNTVTLSTTTATVPAGEGIMVKGTAGETFTINVAASGTEIDGNLLKGQTTTGNVAASTSGTYHYVFGYKTSDATEYGFYNLTADTSVPAGKAYLETKTELTGARIAMIFDDEEATGINNVKREEISSNRFYNLNGQEIAQPSKGLYIVNGKKVVIK